MHQQKLGIFVPSVLLLFVVVDVATCGMSLERFAFRPGELAIDGHPDDAPFNKNRHFTIDSAHGDLPAIGNIEFAYPGRREVMTTDALGFRNLPKVLESPKHGIVFGDSFAFGGSLNDDETFAVRLSERLGRNLYNAGGRSLRQADGLNLLRRFGLHRGVVFDIFYERSPVPAGADAAPAEFNRHQLDPRQFFRKSRIKIAAEKLHKLVHDGTLLPNDQAWLVEEKTLANGEQMLFFTVESIDADARDVTGAGEQWAQNARRVRELGLDLIVVLVPVKLRVYGALCSPPVPGMAGPSPYLRKIGEQLRAAGVHYVDVTESLQAGAREGLAMRQYTYWPDDTHWTARGVSLAADVVAASWPYIDGGSSDAAGPLVPHH